MWKEMVLTPYGIMKNLRQDSRFPDGDMNSWRPMYETGVTPVRFLRLLYWVLKAEGHEWETELVSDHMWVIKVEEATFTRETVFSVSPFLGNDIVLRFTY